MDETLRREKNKKRRIQYVNTATFDSYIRKIYASLDTDISISSNAVKAIDSIICHLFEQLAAEAKDLMLCSRRRTLMEQDICYAVKNCFSADVARRAIEEGQRAVHSYEEMARRR